MTLTPDQIAAYVLGGVGLVAAILERWRAARRQAKTDTESELLSDAKMHQERAKVLQLTAEANLALFRGEQEEHKKTRDYWHAKASDFQTSLLNAQDKIAELTARPDLTDILRCIKEQAETSVAILKRIDQIFLVIENQINPRP